jgi:DNA integrity scanning protein DisA with diadenylate cyclase activity
MFDSILCQVTEYDPEVIGLAVEIAREGREGRRLGTLFTVGDENAVLPRSRPFILDPLSGHPESSLPVANLNLRGTIKELTQIDRAFVVSREGIFLSACRYLDAVAAQVHKHRMKSGWPWRTRRGAPAPTTLRCGLCISPERLFPTV